MHLTKSHVVEEKKRKNNLKHSAHANILWQEKCQTGFHKKRCCVLSFCKVEKVHIFNFFCLRNFLSYACSKKQISVRDEKFAINQAQSHTQQFPCDRPNKINNPPVLL